MSLYTWLCFFCKVFGLGHDILLVHTNTFTFSIGVCHIISPIHHRFICWSRPITSTSPFHFNLLNALVSSSLYFVFFLVLLRVLLLFFLLEFFLYFFSSLLVCSAFPLVSCWWPLSSPLISHPLLSCSFSLVPCSAVFCFVTPWSLVRCFFIFCFSFFCSLTPFSFSLFSCSQFSGPFSLVIWCL